MSDITAAAAATVTPSAGEPSATTASTGVSLTDMAGILAGLRSAPTTAVATQPAAAESASVPSQIDPEPNVEPDAAPAEPTAADPEPATEPPAAPAAPASELHPDLAAAIAEAKAGDNQALAKLLARVNKLTAKNSALAAQLQQANPTAPQSQPAAEPKPAPPPVADNATQQFDAQIEQARQEIAFAEANPHGGQFDNGKGGTVEMTPAQIAQIKANAQVRLTEAATRKEFHIERARETQAAQFEASQALAIQMVPALADNNSMEAGLAMQIIKETPTLMQAPNAPQLVAELVLARLTRAKALKAHQARTAAPAVRRAPVTGGAPAAAPSRSAAQQQVLEAQAQFEKDRSPRSMANLLRAQRLANAS